MEKTVHELLDGGSCHTIHLMSIANAAQSDEVVSVLAKLAKASYVELKEPLPPTVCEQTNNNEDGEKTSQSSGGALVVSSGNQVSTFVAPKVEWGQLSRRKIWVLCRLLDGTTPEILSYNEQLLRGAAVEVLCARTYQCNTQFKAIILATPIQIRKQFPRILMHLSGVKKGTQRLADFTAPPLTQKDGQIIQYPIVEEQLEEWLNYDHCEDAEGNIAQYQEDVFNGAESIKVVKYDHSMGQGDAFIRIMRDPLKFSIVVHTLDMTKSYAGDVTCRSLASILHTSRKIHTLILQECSVTDVGIAELAMALRTSPYVKKLVLARNPQITDVGITALATAFSEGSKCAIETLDLSKNNSVCSEALQWKTEPLNILWDAFGVNKTLKEVNLSECELQPHDVYEMAYRWISKSESLETLLVSDNSFGDQAAALLLEQIPSVTNLDLSHTGISAAGFRAAGLAISKGKPLRKLNLNSNNAMGFSKDTLTAEHLAKDEHLSEDMKEVLAMPHHETSTSSMETFLKSLVDNTTLTDLSLARVNVGDAGVSILCDLILHKQCALKVLDISCNCNIDEQSAHRLKELIWGGYYEREEGEEPPTMDTITLAGNSTNIGERALLALYENRGLKHFDVSDMALNDAMLLPLAEAVVQNKFLCLTSLYVGRNFLFADGVKNLAVLVDRSNTLEVLSIAHTWQSFTDEAGRGSSLSKTREHGLHYMRPLMKTLGRVGNAQTSSSTQDADAVRNASPPKLKMLDLSFNDVSNELATAFAEALVHNDTFEKLWLLGNPLVSEEICAREPRLAMSVPLN